MLNIDQVLIENRRIILSIVYKYRIKGYDQEDLEQEAM